MANKKVYPVMAVFRTRRDAEDAILELKRVGFTDGQIGMVARNDQGEVVMEKAGQTMAPEGAAAGAVIGAGAGTLVGLGVLSGAIPVLGPVVAIGTLGTLLLNAAAGAAVVGLVGALVGLGIPEEDARFYEEEVKGGGHLVSVHAEDRADEAWTILQRAGGYTRTLRPGATTPAANTGRPAGAPNPPATTYPPT